MMVWISQALDSELPGEQTETITYAIVTGEIIVDETHRISLVDNQLFKIADKPQIEVKWLDKAASTGCLGSSSMLKLGLPVANINGCGDVTRLVNCQVEKCTDVTYSIWRAYFGFDQTFADNKCHASDKPTSVSNSIRKVHYTYASTIDIDNSWKYRGFYTSTETFVDEIRDWDFGSADGSSVVGDFTNYNNQHSAFLSSSYFDCEPIRDLSGFSSMYVLPNAPQYFELQQFVLETILDTQKMLVLTKSKFGNAIIAANSTNDMRNIDHLSAIPSGPSICLKACLYRDGQKKCFAGSAKLAKTSKITLGFGNKC